MKLQGPAPGAGISINGLEMRCDANGQIEIADSNADAIRTLIETHGYRAIPKDQPTPPAPLAHARRDDRAKPTEPGHQNEKAPNDPPRPTQPLPTPPGPESSTINPVPTPDTPVISDEAIDAMSRDDMFAFLKARAVSVPGNISNVLLRKAVEEHRADPVKPATEA